MDRQRYQKQMLFSGIGSEGQQSLQQARVLLVGCGALGCVVADLLVRAGVGLLRIVDRDFVELSNLQRQSLFTEADVRDHLPKAVAASARLGQVNSTVEVEPIVADADFSNLPGLAKDVSLILDGTDNFEIRYLINDVALQQNTPWIFTGCTGSSGQIMPVLPGNGPCLRCLMPHAPPPGTTETCDTAGVLGPAIGVISSLQAALAIRILVQGPEKIVPRMTVVDVWEGHFREVSVAHLTEQAQCPACHEGERLWLNGAGRSSTTTLCGRNAVQISPAEPLKIPLPELGRRLQASGEVLTTRFLVRLTPSDPIKSDDDTETTAEITVFADGRAIIRGTSDPAVARTLYSRYIGG